MAAHRAAQHREFYRECGRFFIVMLAVVQAFRFVGLVMSDVTNTKNEILFAARAFVLIGHILFVALVRIIKLCPAIRAFKDIHVLS